jgi:hypothetical protein
VTLADDVPPRGREPRLPDLDLPVDPGFVSVLPRPSFAEMLLWLEELRQSFPQSFPTEEERLASKCDAEFVL